MNAFFVKKGIGWKLVDQRLEARYSDAKAQTLDLALDLTKKQGSTKVQEALRLALAALSRRPRADVSAAMRHASEALESAMREVTGDSEITLAELLKVYPKLMPKPLHVVLAGLLDFGSEAGQAFDEGIELGFAEAQLHVGMTAAAVSYLLSLKPKEMGQD